MKSNRGRILLLNPPGDKLYLRDEYCSAVSKADYYWPAIDLLVLSGILSQYYDVEVLDAIAEKKDFKECYRHISNSDYSAIVFLTGGASWKEDLSFVSSLKGDRDFKLIGNGDILLTKGKELMELYPLIDAILFDFTTNDILKFLDAKYDEIRNMVFRSEGKIFESERDLGERAFSYPVPRHELFPLKNYLLPHGRRFPFTMAVMNFGCPFKCSFCVAATLGYKYRNVDNAMLELRYIHSLGIKEVFFCDFTFEANRKNIESLCKRMIEEGLDLTWICSSRVNTVDEPLLKLMKEAGCHTIMFGVESGDDKILQNYAKGTTVKQIKDAFQLCNALSIRTLAHFIIGLPGETEETIRKTIDISKKLDCDFASFNIAIPAFGTQLRKDSIDKGYILAETDVLDSSHAFPTIEAEGISTEKVRYWRNRAVREFYFRPRYIRRKLFSAKTLYEWKILLKNGLAIFADYRQ